MYCQKTDSFSGEVFKENFTDIFYTNLEQIAFSIAFPIKNSVKKKTSLFVEKKPKAKISLHIKIGDYLSSGDKIGEKESNIHEAHYVTRSSASALASPCPCPSGKGKANKSSICKGKASPDLYTFGDALANRKFASASPKVTPSASLCNPFCKGKAKQLHLRCQEDLYAHQLRFAKKFAWTSTRQTLYKSKMMASPSVKQSEALRRRALRSSRSKASKLASPCPCPSGKGKANKSSICKCKPNKSKQIGPRTQLDLYGPQLRFVRRFAGKWNSLLIALPLPEGHGHGDANLRLTLACKSSICKPCPCPSGKGKAIKSSICKSTQSRCKSKGMSKRQKNIRTPLVLTSSGRVVMISKNQLVLQKTQPVLFYDSANLHVKKGEFVLQGAPLLTLTHQTLITGDIVQGIPRIEQLFEAFTSPQKGLKDKKRLNVHDTLHSQVRDIFRKNWLKNILSVAVRKSLEEIGSILLEMIQKVYLSQGVLISDKHIEIIIRQMTSKGQILDSGSTGLLLEEVLPIRQIENANITTPGKKCLYVPSVVGLTAAALTCDSFISAASFQETTRVLSRDAVGGKTDFLRGLKEKVVIGDLISAGTGLDIYFVYTLFSESISYVQQSKTGGQ